MRKAETLSGTTVGRWTVGKAVTKTFPCGQSPLFYECVCACGTKKLVSRVALAGGRTLGCTPCRGADTRGRKSPLWKGHEGIGSTTWTAIISNARIRDLPFEVTIQQAWELFLLQGEKCALTGLPLTIKLLPLKPGTASFDRIDSAGGYTLGNVQWVHKDVNRMKNAFPEERFFEICRLVADTHSPPQGVDLSPAILSFAG